MKYREFKLLSEQNLISTVRVVPIPLTKGWCIDVLIKDVLNVGSRTEVLESDRSTQQQHKVRRFGSIDSAARYRKQMGISSFMVELDDAITFVDAGPKPVEKTALAELTEGAYPAAANHAEIDPLTAHERETKEH